MIGLLYLSPTILRPILPESQRDKTNTEVPSAKEMEIMVLTSVK